VSQLRRSDVSSWVDRYVRVWNTNDANEIGELFTEDAVYLTGPFDTPWEGRQVIVDQWLKERDEPGTTSFSYEVVAADGDLGVVQGRATYVEPPAVYGNLWLIRLTANGRCSHFTEYWMKKKG
jgi:uncharacterized protein (TIGR02246 family)